jgi:hypothetical protein
MKEMVKGRIMESHPIGWVELSQQRLDELRQKITGGHLILRAEDKEENAKQTIKMAEFVTDKIDRVIGPCQNDALKMLRAGIGHENDLPKADVVDKIKTAIGAYTEIKNYIEKNVCFPIS